MECIGLAQNQKAIFKIPLNPTQNTGNPTATTGGNIGIFINGLPYLTIVMELHGARQQMRFVVALGTRLALGQLIGIAMQFLLKNQDLTVQKDIRPWVITTIIKIRAHSNLTSM